MRDALLGHTPKDLDIATAAPPEVVEASFPQTLAVGKAFGTIVVIEDSTNFEVTTFRREGPYKDGRHPDHVEFTDMKEDAGRRDFTVNAMFYDPISEQIFDFADGVRDLEKSVLRTVGRAEERFQEDRLRMLRAARFVAQLGFVLDAHALKAIQAQHAAIAQVSAERVFNEMRRLLQSSHSAQGLKILRASELQNEVWPEIKNADLDRLGRFPHFAKWEATFAAVHLLAGSSEVEPRLRAWKGPRESLRLVQSYMNGCKLLMNPESSRAARVRVIGSPEFAEILGLAGGLLESEAKIEAWIGEFLEVSDRKGSLPPPFLNGQDLIDLGVPPGERMGSLLKALYDAQLEGDLQSREEALSRVKKSI